MLLQDKCRVAAFTAVLLGGVAAGCGNKHTGLPLRPPTDTMSTNTPSDTTQKDTVSATSYSYLALGDSYTIGEGVSEQERFPNQVTAILNDKGIGIQKPRIIAATGWTTQELLSAIEVRQPSVGFSIVSLLIGVNNQYQRRDTAGYREQFELCLLKAIELAGGNRSRVFVLSIPDYSVTPFGGRDASIATQIDQFNQINRQAADTYQISYTDITPASRQAAGNPSLIAGDGLHPSGKQYAAWAGLLAHAMLPALK